MNLLRRVLVVDDARVSAALRQLLESTPDLRVAAQATTAALARAAVATEAPDLAVVEVALPDLGTGAALIREFAGQFPVIALSIKDAAHAVALAAGARCFLDKDGGTEPLLTALRTTY